MGPAALLPPPFVWSYGGMATSPTSGASPKPGAPAVRTVRTTGVRGVPLSASIPGGEGADEPSAGIVVIQDALGVTNALVSATVRLAADGYLAVAPHLYHRRADAPVEDFDTARPLMNSLNADDMTHDIADAIGYLDAAGIEKEHMGIVGFCMGGSVSLWQATTGAFGAAVTFYGGGVSASRWKGVPPGLESAGELTCPWLGLYGDKDRSISVDEVEKVRVTVASTGVPTSVVRYANAGHAFALDPAAPQYVADSAADAWAHAMSWFDAHLR